MNKVKTVREMSAHTPGPWRAGIGRRDQITAADGSAIGFVNLYGYHHNANTVANARLLAAAPDLLAALIDIATAGERYGVQWDAATMGNVARAAIAKATGKA